MDQYDELRLLRGACAASQTGAWHYRVGEDVVEWTPLLYDLFAVPQRAKLTLEFALSFYLGESRQKVVEAVKSCLSEGKPWKLDVQCQSTEGRVFWARTIGEAIHENGRIVALQGAFQDITRECAAIDERVRAQAELSFVLRTMSDGFFLLDTNWQACSSIRFAGQNCRSLQRRIDAVLGDRLRRQDAVRSDRALAVELKPASLFHFPA
jgi:PAS domain-containing protein